MDGRTGEENGSRKINASETSVAFEDYSEAQTVEDFETLSKELEKWRRFLEILSKDE
ncbi:hypothetical protein NPIL_161021, partial [Nephila pilipes]